MPARVASRLALLLGSFSVLPGLDIFVSSPSSISPAIPLFTIFFGSTFSFGPARILSLATTEDRFTPNLL